ASGFAAGDVVKVRGVAGGYVLCVDGWVDEANGRIAVGDQLLIDQSDEARPHGSGEAGAAVLIRQARCLVGAGVEGEIRVCRDVWAIAIGRRTLVAGVDYARELLPGRNRDLVRRDPAAAVYPGGFRFPGAARAGGGQIRPADGDDIGIVRRPRLISPRPGRTVAGRGKEILALSRHFLEVRIERAGIVRRPAP